MKTSTLRTVTALVFSCCLLLIMISLTPADEGEKPKYVGAEACAKICHKAAKQGEQLKIWQNSAHCKAYETLASEKAMSVAKEKGIENPQEAEECLTCHVTAPGIGDEMKEPTFSKTEGVGCERCHGPGSLYKKMSIMKDIEKAKELGLQIPDEQTCLECHNEKSPTYVPFTYEERWAQIAHPIPEE